MFTLPFTPPDLTRAGRPVRANLSKAVEVSTGYLAPAEAWEAFLAHGLLPHNWATDPRRVFPAPCETCRVDDLTGCARPCRRKFGRGARLHASVSLDQPWRLASTPPSWALAVGLAADAEGVQRAEELAWDVAHRLRPWSRVFPARIAWVTRTRHGTPRTRYDGLDRVRHALRTAVRTPYRDPLERAMGVWKPDGWFAACAAEDVLDQALWAFAARAGTLPFEPVPSPFEPLVALRTQGYALLRLDAAAVVLAAPAELP